ncbi:uncharacterized protein LOC142349824 isoform X2 [Convolutriloba macropyga]
MERIAIEDQLEKLGEKQTIGFKASPSTSLTSSPSTKPPAAPSSSSTGRSGAGLRPGPSGKRLSSHTFSAGDKNSGTNRTGVAQRPSMMSALTSTKPPLTATKSSFTPDESSSGSNSLAVPGRGVVRSASQAKEQIMLWAQRCTSQHGVPVKNMTSSFSDGVAFCAIVHYYFPDAFNFEDCLKMPRKERIAFAFQKAEDLGHVPQLIDPEDLILMGKKPDYKVMFTYMSEMYRNLKKREQMIPEEK